MRFILTIACVFLAVAAQRPGGFGGFGGRPGRPGGLGKLLPKCSDGGRPTCTCANGNVIDRPGPNPCGDNSTPTSCICQDGSTPTRESPCNDGNKPTCANGLSPVCQVSIVKLGSRSRVYLKSLRDLNLELLAIIAMS